MSGDLIYQDIDNMNALKQHMAQVLEEYNSTSGMSFVDLVLFKDAVEHGKLLDFHIPYVCNLLHVLFRVLLRNNLNL